MEEKERSRPKTVDYYRLLGVDAKATLKEIKNAFRRHALNLHPDVSGKPEDHDRFRAVGEAYRILSDPQLRKRYDAMRLLGFGLPIASAREFARDPARVQAFIKKSARIFANVSGMTRKSSKRPGRDLTVAAALAFAESWTGVRRAFRYGREIDCADCEGKGFSEVSVCKICEGAGKIASDYLPILSKRCPRCGARGWIGEAVCAPCEGKGRKLIAHEIKVDVPPGVHDKARLRIRGHGEGGRFGGADGDLIVEVTVAPDPVLSRQGNDLIALLPVDFAAAALGGVAEIALPDGSLKIRVPEGSWNNRRLRVPGRGFADPVTKQPGDLFATISMRFPEDMDPETQSLVIRYLAAVHGENDAPAGDFKDQLAARFGQSKNPSA